MRARVSKWGKSLAIRLPQAAAKSHRVHEGEQVELSIKGYRLEIRAARPRYRLEDLLREITPDNQPEALDVQTSARKAGHEQAGRRPALVLNPGSYHQKTALAVVCPITSNTQPYPFKVLLPDGLPIGGAVLADQVKSIDRTARQLKVAGPAPRAVVAEVQARITALLGIDD